MFGGRASKITYFTTTDENLADEDDDLNKWNVVLQNKL